MVRNGVNDWCKQAQLGPGVPPTILDICHCAYRLVGSDCQVSALVPQPDSTAEEGDDFG
jgi:hypothetical protein